MYRVTLRPRHGGVQTEAAVLERERHVMLPSPAQPRPPTSHLKQSGWKSLPSALSLEAAASPVRGNIGCLDN